MVKIRIIGVCTDSDFVAFCPGGCFGMGGGVRGRRVFLKPQQGAEVGWRRFGEDLAYLGHWVWQEEWGWGGWGGLGCRKATWETAGGLWSSQLGRSARRGEAENCLLAHPSLLLSSRSNFILFIWTALTAGCDTITQTQIKYNERKTWNKKEKITYLWKWDVKQADTLYQNKQQTERKKGKYAKMTRKY